MASALIHIAIAKEVNKKLKRKEDLYLLGSIAPDISKFIGQSKQISHFMDAGHNEPNLDNFLNKYLNYLNDDFVMGYYIHLFGDYLWFKYFIPNFVDKEKGTLKTLKWGIINTSHKKIIQYIYDNYSSLNSDILENYQINLELFHKELPNIQPIITEIPFDKLKILTDKILNIIENEKMKENYIFDLKCIQDFITNSVQIIISNLEELHYLDK